MTARRAALSGVAILALVTALVLGACGQRREDETAAAGAPPPDVPPPAASGVPAPDLADMEPRVQIILRDAQRRVLENLGSGREWGRYGMVLDAHEVHGAAIVAYQMAARLAPREFRWRYLLARVLQHQEFDAIDIDEVEQALRAALELESGYAPAWSRLGAILAQQGRHAEARQAFERALAIDPTSVEAQTGLGRALLSLGETDAALERVEPWAAEAPDSWELQLLLARVYAVAGLRDRARKAAARARELPQKAQYPDPIVSEMMGYAVSATACFKRARDLAAVGDFEGAVTNLKVVVEVRPDYAPAHERLGWCRLQLGRSRAARQDFLTAIELAPDLVEAHAGLARALEELGEPAEAALARGRADSLRAVRGARQRADDFVPAGS